MAKRNVSEIETGAGFFMGLVNAMMDIAREKDVPFEAIYRLVTAGGRKTLSSMIDLAYTNWQAEQPKPVEQPPQSNQAGGYARKNDSASLNDHYRNYITYRPIPSIDALKNEWGEDGVDVVLDGRPFTYHASCLDMDRTPGWKIFYLHEAGGEWESEERIAWGAKQRTAFATNGYRPATHEETYEFAKAHPELTDFVGLGSYAMVNIFRCGSLVLRLAGLRVLGFPWLVTRWPGSTRCLFVSV